MARTAVGRATPRHPGDILREDYLPRLPDPNQAALAKRLGISRPRLNELLHRKRSVTPDTALRLARFFRTPAGFWLQAQAEWDLGRALRSGALLRALEAIEPWDVVTPEGGGVTAGAPPAPSAEEWDARLSRYYEMFLAERGLLRHARRFARVRAGLEAAGDRTANGMRRAGALGA